jgi:hypothetical protein
MEQMVMTIFCMPTIIRYKNTKCKWEFVRAFAQRQILPESVTLAAFPYVQVGSYQALFFQTAVDDGFDFLCQIAVRIRAMLRHD